MIGGIQISSTLRNMLIALGLACFSIQAVGSMLQKSVTIDEIMYVASGHYYLKTGDFGFNPTHPPLMKMFSALPLMLLDLNSIHYNETLENGDIISQWQVSRSFLYHNKEDADFILFLARLPVVCIALILGVFVYRWAALLYGPIAGLGALVLYAFSPNMIAHSRLATQDLGLTSAMFIASFYFWRLTREPKLNIKYLIICGTLFGAAILIKTTALFLIAIFGLFILMAAYRSGASISLDANPLNFGKLHFGKITRMASNHILRLTLIGLIGIAILNLGYLGDGTFTTLKATTREDVKSVEEPQSSQTCYTIKQLVKNIPLPLPKPYLKMLLFQRNLTSASSGVYFKGRIYEPGLWYLTIVTFLIKTPIPLLVLFTFSMAFLVYRKHIQDAELLLLLTVLVIFSIFMVLGNVNVSIRYILPAYPCLHVLSAKLFSVDFASNRKSVFAGAALLIFYVAASVAIYPHYLAYFNEFIGGPRNGYKYLSGSNIDWGQDLKVLKTYMVEKRIDKIKLGYFGSADADYYDINYDFLPSVGLRPKESSQYWWYDIDDLHRYDPGPQKGIVAVSATLLASPGWLKPKFYQTYQWLREHEPIDQIGHSILIYKIE